MLIPLSRIEKHRPKSLTKRSKLNCNCLWWYINIYEYTRMPLVGHVRRIIDRHERCLSAKEIKNIFHLIENEQIESQFSIYQWENRIFWNLHGTNSLWTIRQTSALLRSAHQCMHCTLDLFNFKITDFDFESFAFFVHSFRAHRPLSVHESSIHIHSWGHFSQEP